MATPPNSAVLLTNCGQLIDFKAKMHKIQFPLGLCPRLHWGSLQRSHKPIAVFKGPTSKGRSGKKEGRGRGREMESKRSGEVRRGDRRGGEGPALPFPQIFWPRTAPDQQQRCG